MFNHLRVRSDTNRRVDPRALRDIGLRGLPRPRGRWPGFGGSGADRTRVKINRMVRTLPASETVLLSLHRGCRIVVTRRLRRPGKGSSGSSQILCQMRSAGSIACRHLQGTLAIASAEATRSSLEGEETGPDRGYPGQRPGEPRMASLPSKM